MSPLFGRFLEYAIGTPDIAASVRFYEQLGFTQLQCGDSWSHAYGVVSDGRLCIGLHQLAAAPPVLRFVYPGVAAHMHDLRARGIEPHYMRLGAEDFHELQFHDPAGQIISLLEARTFSPGLRLKESRCGYFYACSVPALDFDAMQTFWERAGLVALEESALVFPQMVLTGDDLSLALHRPRSFDEPVLVFQDPAMRERLEDIATFDLSLDRSNLPHGLDPERNAVLRAPEGTMLLLLNAEA